MITIASVWTGDKYGAEYQAIQRDMILRNLAPEYKPRFVCITDRPDELPEGVEAVEPEPGLPGWWQKVALFKPGKLPVGRIAYFDLDLALIGGLEDLFECAGINKNWFMPGYDSSVMVWDAGDHADVWERFTPNVMERLRGDQDWLSELGGWETFPGEWCVSYKAHARIGPPHGAKVVSFHGLPKPHEISRGWVPAVWKVGGGFAIPIYGEINVHHDRLMENVRLSSARGLPVFTGKPPEQIEDRECCLIGGGPSLEGRATEIAERQAAGAAVVSMNGSLRWLLGHGITPSSHIVVDARAESAQFARDVPHETALFIASQCAPETFDEVRDHPRVSIWHPMLSSSSVEELRAVLVIDDVPIMLVGGGSTVGLRAMYLAFLSGFMDLHLYGYDSCYRGDGAHHAFSQPLNDGERVTEVLMGGGRYLCAGWMAAQAQQFNGQHSELVAGGVHITAHGGGLIPDICRLRNEVLALQKNALAAATEEGKETARKAADLCSGRAVAVQAGAATGGVPLELAGLFSEVIAFEPHPENFARAKEAINGANVRLVPSALGESQGVVGLLLPDLAIGNYGAWQTRGPGDVPVQTIDSLDLHDCDLIMLDIEGDELLALRGAEQTIMRHKPVIVFEDKGLGERHGHEAGAVAQWLEGRSYRLAARHGNDTVMVPIGETE